MSEAEYYQLGIKLTFSNTQPGRPLLFTISTTYPVFSSVMSDITLTFSPNDPCQTEIKHLSGEIAYRSITEQGEPTVTRVYDSSGKEIASLEWGVGFPDRVTFRGSKPKSITEWMSKSSVPLKE